MGAKPVCGLGDTHTGYGYGLHSARGEPVPRTRCSHPAYNGLHMAYTCGHRPLTSWPRHNHHWPGRPILRLRMIIVASPSKSKASRFIRASLYQAKS
jgi:hypothetical protein